jgi:hypothetical protein
MSNKKISELEERVGLKSNCTESALNEYEGDQDLDLDSTYFMIARENIKNEKINFNRFKSSTLDSSLLDHGAQSLKGVKTFNANTLIEGNAYIEHITSGSYQDNVDETICFKYKANINQNIFHINFPKTFKRKPVLSVSTQCSSGSILPFIIFNVTEYKFSIKFATNITQEDFYIHTTAYSPSFALGEGLTNIANQGSAQSFIQEVTSGTDRAIISFPTQHQSSPIVSACLEGSGPVIPSALSNINNSSCEIIFSSNLPENYYVHIISHEQG